MKIKRLLCVLICNLVTYSALGSKISTQIEANTLITDNVLLSSNKSSDQILVLNPSIKFFHEKSKIKLASEYQADFLKYRRFSNKDTINHEGYIQLEKNNSNYEFLVYSNLYQDILNPNQQLLNPNFQLGDKKPYIFKNSVNQQINKKLYNASDVSFLLNLGRISFHQYSPQTSPIYNIKYSVNAKSLSKENNDFSWSLINLSEMNYQDNNQINRIDKSIFHIDYFISYRLGIFYELGYEKDESALNQKISGMITSLGINYKANHGNNLEFKIGKQSFGYSYGFNFEWNRKRFFTNLKYNESVSTDTQIRFSDKFDETNFYENNEDLNYYTELNNQIFVSKEGMFLARYNFKKSNIKLTSFKHARHYINSPTFEKFYGSGLSWEGPINKNLQVSTHINYVKQVFSDKTVNPWRQFKINFLWNTNDKLSYQLSLQRYISKPNHIPGVNENNIRLSLKYIF